MILSILLFLVILALYNTGPPVDAVERQSLSQYYTDTLKKYCIAMDMYLSCSHIALFHRRILLETSISQNFCMFAGAWEGRWNTGEPHYITETPWQKIRSDSSFSYTYYVILLRVILPSPYVPYIMAPKVQILKRWSWGAKEHLA